MSKITKGALIAAVAMSLAVPTAAPAQFGSDGYKFLKAVRDQDGTVVTDLLNKPGTTIVDYKDPSTGETALHVVTKRRDLSWLSFLLGKGANANAKDRQGNTALMIAAGLGFTDGAEMLIKRARVDEPNNSGETPLIRAAQIRDIQMVRLLMQAGANPDRRDTLAGLSAKDYAKRDTRGAAVLKVMEDAKKTPNPKLMGPN